MCGICGVVRLTGEPVAREALERACLKLRHRGPDHSGVWARGGRDHAVGLGATRLAVIDPTAASHQPMHDPTGRFHLVFNGEIYNFRSLRRDLVDTGEQFLTDGDTEVVLVACARWSVDALSRFNGMWALAFYDSLTHTGFLSRDRFGIKPLFYRATAHTLDFASELGALTALGATGGAVDTAALTEHLQFGYIAHPKTIYQGIRRLEPGHCLRFGEAGIEAPVKYYRPTGDTYGDRQHSDYAGRCARLRRTVADAVAARKMSDVPMGAFLSGGLDSSIVTAHLVEASGYPVWTFSIGYADEKRYDETAFARVVAKALKTEHHELIVSQRDVVEEIPRILDHLDEPVGDSSIVPTSLISRFARQHVTVVLSGDGADELFGGYWRYLGHQSLAMYQSLPLIVRRWLVEPALRTVSRSGSSAPADRIRQFQKLARADSSDYFARHLAWSRILAPEAEGLFADAKRPHDYDMHLLTIARQLTAGMPETDPLNRILSFDLQYQLPADMLQKVDLAGMAHSLEVRVPFLDNRVVEFVAAAPGNLKIHGGLRKRLLIDTYRGCLPDLVLDRPKQGFEVPVGALLRGPLEPMFRDVVTRDVVESFGILRHEAVDCLYEEHCSGRADNAALLFALLSLCWWRRRESGGIHTSESRI
ncbi:MAG: asparagine synthase (glutamine-hydrolyzing) [Phycisphaerae bacterium]